MKTTTQIAAEMGRLADQASATNSDPNKDPRTKQRELKDIRTKVMGLEAEFGETRRFEVHRNSLLASLGGEPGSIGGGPGPGVGYGPAGPYPEAIGADRLTPSQSVSGWLATKGLGRRPDEPPLNFGRWFKGFATGDWTDAEVELKAMSEGTPSAGGVLVPTPLASYVLDLARNQARVFQAGAVTVPMTSQTLKIARQTGDPALAWHTEAATINPSSLTFDAVTLKAQTLPCLIKVSLELLEDAPNADSVISNAIAMAMALELDRVALRGSGIDPEPKGIRNTSGVTIQSMGANGAAPTNFDPFLTAIEAVRTANWEPNAAIYSPRTSGELSRLKDSQLNPMRLPDDFAALSRLVTNQVPNTNTQGTASTASDAYVGQWNELLIGLRTSLSIRALQEKYVDTGEFGFFAYLRADVQVAHPAAFTVIQGLL